MTAVCLRVRAAAVVGAEVKSREPTGVRRGADEECAENAVAVESHVAAQGGRDAGAGRAGADRGGHPLTGICHFNHTEAVTFETCMAGMWPGWQSYDNIRCNRTGTVCHLSQQWHAVNLLQ